MGRREQGLDPDAGPLARFASELRALRGGVHPVSYRELARRAHYSATTLSAAAGGRSLPSLDVTLAYATACGADLEYWRIRWQQAVAEINAAGGPAAAPPLPGPPFRPAGPGAVPPAAGRIDLALPPTTQPAPHRLTRYLLPLTLAVGLLAIAVVVPALTGTGPGDDLSLPSPPPSPVVTDQSEPMQSGCSKDAISLESEPLTLNGPAEFGGQRFAAGTPIGSLDLRYSARCAAAWARLIPAPLLNGHAGGQVAIQLRRPADKTTLGLQIGALTVAEGNVLLTEKGCVMADGAIISATGQQTGVSTECRGRPPVHGPV